jgi:hypothetical protein
MQEKHNLTTMVVFLTLVEELAIYINMVRIPTASLPYSRHRHSFCHRKRSRGYGMRPEFVASHSPDERTVIISEIY